MDKYIILDSQIENLKEKGLKIGQDDEERLCLFLKDKLYYCTINQVKFYYKINDTYNYNDVSDLIDKYKKLKEIDYKILSKILEIESSIKENIIQEIKNKNLYKNNDFTDEIIKNQLQVFKYLGVKTKDKVKYTSYMKEKAYKIIISCSLDELNKKILQMNNFTHMYEEIFKKNFPQISQEVILKKVVQTKEEDIKNTLINKLPQISSSLSDVKKIELLSCSATWENFFNKEVSDYVELLLKKYIKEGVFPQDVECPQEGFIYVILDSKTKKNNLFTDKIRRDFETVEKIYDNYENITKSREFKKLNKSMRCEIIKIVFDKFIIANFSNNKSIGDIFLLPNPKKFRKDIIKGMASKKISVNHLKTQCEIQKQVYSEIFGQLVDIRNKIAHGYSYVECFKKNMNKEIYYLLLEDLLKNDYKQAKEYIGFKRK